MVGIVAMSAFLLLPSVAMAGPVNDKFEDAQPLGPGLPVAVTQSNKGAGKEEPGEPPVTFAAGHSVWFGWEGQSDQLVTVDTCGSGFTAILAVFTGPELGGLEELGQDHRSGTPACSPGSGAAFTFEAETGVTYWIMVDGEDFFVEEPPPVSEGMFSLAIGPTPRPANDDFENAATLEGSVTEEPGGARFYNAFAEGYNWNATKQAGEPNHGGDPGGASVWYDWTAPASGNVRVDACASIGSLLGVYVGDRIDALTPVASESAGFFGSPLVMPCNLSFDAGVGITYRIAVDGKLDTDSGVPWMDRFGTHLAMMLARKQQDAGVPDPVPAVTLPETAVHRRVLRRQPPVFVSTFSSNEPGSTFRCKLDKRSFVKCRSPKRFSRLKPGRHIFQVYAVDAAGNRDPSPAVVHFRMPRAHRHKHVPSKSPRS